MLDQLVCLVSSSVLVIHLRITEVIGIGIEVIIIGTEIIFIILRVIGTGIIHTIGVIFTIIVVMVTGIVNIKISSI